MKKKILLCMLLTLAVPILVIAGDVDRAIKKLQDRQTRAEGIKELEQMGQEALPALISALEETGGAKMVKQRDKIIRQDIIRLLSGSKDERGIAPIGAFLVQSKEKDERILAAICLGMTGNKKAIAFLKQGLKDKDKTVKLRAAYALGRLKDDSGYHTAIQYLNDNEPKIREQAIEAIGRIGKIDGATHVEQALQDENIWVRIKAKTAKRRIELNQLSEQEKINYLKNTLENDEQYEVQKWAANELAETGEEGINILRTIAKELNSQGAWAAYKGLKRHGINLE